MDFVLIGEDGETYSEEDAKLFDSKKEAWEWCRSGEAMKWKPCTFDILESSYN
jgi:hypothetical protein